ncbi:MAG: molybdopterin oxidoreductase family protein [Acidimicrobiia bacterium]|nr:molybdopterin oxidoreductase family protein [Acidimicrobiia bacterium]
MATETAYRTCPLCEATCGLEITLENGAVGRIRGDRDDVFSHGFICPKGSTLKQLEADPDRLRAPMIREGSKWSAASWDEAFALIEARLMPMIAERGPDSVGVYLGNPNVHNLAGILYGRVFLKALRTRSIFTAATVDQMPKHVSSGLMFGHPDLIPVPDIDRTSYLLMLGADPYESNGSLATAPDWPGRMEAILERDGKVVVVDPRRSKTAAHASEHIPIRPGTDALFLAAVVNVLADEGLVADLPPFYRGAGEALTALDALTPERVAGATGIGPATTRRIARELAAAESAVVYGRVGTHTVRFGTVSSWLVDLLNILTGNLDRPGGAMFPSPAHSQPRSRRGFLTGRWKSRVRGLPEVRGELPVSALAEEIETPGEGQIRAVVVIAGNPVLSTPNSERLDSALSQLDFMVSVDLYRNETSRHADVILPATPPLQRSHYDLAFTGLAVRNIANYSPAVLPDELGMTEWEVLCKLAGIVSGQGSSVEASLVDDFAFTTYLQGRLNDSKSTIHGRDMSEILEMIGDRRGPERFLDLMLRTGPYGDHFGENRDGLTLAALEAAPHGVDLGPLSPRLPEALCTPDGTVDLAPQAIIDDLPRLEETLAHANGMLLIGRRHVRSNNSWMHNIDVLVKGRERCTLLIHPEDALRLGIENGGSAEVVSSTGKLVAPVEVKDSMMPGVVSLPHGWGHDLEGTELSIASSRPGVNFNALSDETDIDPLSGNATLNAIPVTVRPAG